MDNAHLTIRVIEGKPRHDVVYSLIEGLDGTLYVGLSGETGKDGCYAQILSYDREQGTFDTLVDLEKVIAHPEHDLRPPHSKLHTTFCMASDGRLLASTHMTAPPANEDFYHYWHIYNDPERHFAGSHLVIYDPKTRSAEDFGIIAPKGGARYMTYNPEREEVYVTSFLSCHFYVARLKTGEVKDLGRISQHDWLGPCYCPADGRVYVTDSLGNFIRYTPETEALDWLPLRTPRESYTSPEATGIFNLVAHPNGRKLYGSVWNTAHVFEFDPLAGSCGAIRDYGCLGEERHPTSYSPNLRFPRMLTVGYDNKIYLSTRTYIQPVKESPSLYAVDIDSGEQEDLGPLAAEGFPRFPGACCCCASRDGSIYWGGNPTDGGITALYIYSPEGKNKPVPAFCEPYRNPPPFRKDYWMDETYHSMSRIEDNHIYCQHGTFIVHEEGMSGTTPLAPRKSMAISCLAQDAVTGALLGVTQGEQCRLFTFWPSIKHFQPLTTFGRSGDTCRAIAMLEDGTVFFGTSNHAADGQLFRYDYPAARQDFIEMATCDRGEFCSYDAIIPEQDRDVRVVPFNFPKTTELRGRGVPEHEGFVTMVSIGQKLYGITTKGSFFEFDGVSEEVRFHDIFRRYVQEAVNISRSMAVWQGKVLFSGHHGRIIVFDPATHSFAETAMKIPCGAGREYLNSMTALVPALDDGVFYGATLSDGYLFRLDMNAERLVNLGKPVSVNEIRSLTVGRDGKVWGLAGTPSDCVRFFCYDPASGEHRDYGVIRAKMPYTWVVQHADCMLTGLDGELYIGESDDISHLVSYFPPIG